jgi:F0F1-type ATP synthase membrane subunit b/b'
MSFKLTKAQIEQKGELSAKLTTALDELNASVEAFNLAVADERATLQTSLDAYNAVLSEAREFASDIASQADQDISDKSEKWQEGERGQAAIEYKDAWETLAQSSLDDLEIEMPDELEIDEPDHVGELDNAPEEASQ